MDNSQMLIVVGVAAGAFLLGGILFPPSWKDRGIAALKWLAMPRSMREKRPKESGKPWWDDKSDGDGHHPEPGEKGDHWLADAIAEIRERGGKVELPQPEPVVSEKDKAIELLKKAGYHVEKPAPKKRVRNRKRVTAKA